MALKVKKFGGSSLATPDQIDNVARHLHQFWSQGDSVVCVVSAMGDQTDQLAELAFQINSKPPARELDMLLTVGERISMALLCISLAKLEVPAISLTGSQSGILTDSTHGNADIVSIRSDRIEQGLAEGKVVIVAGYQGMCPENKEITTLGRGGSDVSAVALAVHLEAKECDIYSDVEGVFTCNPSLCDDAQVIDNLSWKEMYTFAENGAGVLHPRAVRLAQKHGLQIHVRSSFSPNNPGTLINGKKAMEETRITGVADKQDLCFYECKTKDSKQFMAKMNKWLHDQDAVFSLCSQTQLGEEEHIRQAFPQALLREFRLYTSNLGFEVEFKRVVENVSVITVVGLGLNRDPEMIDKIFSKVDAPILASELDDDSCKLFVSNEFVGAALNSLNELVT